MSIRKMIALHPKDTNNQALGDAVHHLMYASKMACPAPTPAWPN